MPLWLTLWGISGCGGEDGNMWRTARNRSGVNSTLITVVSAFLSLLIASPSSAVAAKVAHSRIKSAAPKPAAPAGKQIATGIFNTDREMLEQTALRIDSTQRLLKLIVALLVLSWGGLFYIARRLPKHQEKSVAWKGKVPASAPDEETVSWQKGEPPNAREGWKFER